MQELTEKELINKGRNMEREHIRQMIVSVLNNPESIAIDSIPPRMVLQVLLASLIPDPEEEEEE